MNRKGKIIISIIVGLVATALLTVTIVFTILYHSILLFAIGITTMLFLWLASLVVMACYIEWKEWMNA